MTKLKTLKPRITTIPSRVPDARAANAGSYGKGRGGRPWRRLREQILRRDPICVICEAQGRIEEAVICDHKVPKSQGGTDHPSNLQGLCKACSDRKTQDESRQARGITPKQAIGEDGWPI